MDLMKIAARVAAEPVAAPAVPEETAFIHMNTDLEAFPDLDPDGSLAAAFGEFVGPLGGAIEDWEGEWLEIQVPRSKLKEMLAALDAAEAGQHGPEVQKIAQAYGVTEVYGDDGEGNPGDVIPEDQY